MQPVDVIAARQKGFIIGESSSLFAKRLNLFGQSSQADLRMGVGVHGFVQKNRGIVGKETTSPNSPHPPA